MSLVITFAPCADESGFGYYRRLAGENSLWGWRELAEIAGVHRNRSALMERPAHVSEMLGVEESWTRAASEQEKLARDWRPLFRAKSDAMCPRCLKESVYIRQHWEHSYVTCCPKHKVRLVDRCDACGKPLAYGREHIAYCICGHDLRDCKTTRPTKAEIWLSSLIVSNGASSGDISPVVQAVPLKSLCLLVRDLCLFFDPNVPPPFRSAGIAKSIQDAVELLAPLDVLLEQWPTRFEQHVSERIEAGKPNAKTLNTLLGTWYIQLRKLCQGTALEPFLRVVIEVASQKFDGSLGLDASTYLAEEVIDHIGVPHAAKMIGVSRDYLLKSVLNGVCSYRTRAFGTRRVRYEIPRQDALRIVQERAGWIHEDDAVIRVGVGETVLRNMIKAGVVNSDVRWRNDVLKGGEIEVKSIDDLYAKLIKNLKTPVSPNDEIVRWSELMSRRLGNNLAIQAVMQAAKNGELRPVKKGSNIGRMGFLKSEVARYFGDPVLEAGVSLKALAEITGWKGETIRYWVDQGLLKTEQVKLPGQQRHVVLPEHLLEFGQAYIPLADLAKTMDTKASALSRNFKGSLETVGALPLANGQRRGGLIRIADLAELALAHVKS